MLASFSEDDNGIDETVGFILKNELPNTTNLLEVDQSRFYSRNDSIQFRSSSKPPSSTNRIAYKSINSKPDRPHQQVDRVGQSNRIDDRSRFNLDIPDELYSVVDGKQVFRLFNHVEHVKENPIQQQAIDRSAFQPNYSTATRSTGAFQPNYSTKSANISSSSKENFRANTLPDDSRFCNFLNQTKFDTLIEDDRLDTLSDGEDEFKTLTESRADRALNRIDQTDRLNERNESQSKSKFADFLSLNSLRSTNCLKEIYSNLDGQPNRNLTSKLINDPINEKSTRYSDYMSFDTKENDLSDMNSSKTNLIKSMHSRLHDYQAKTLTPVQARNQPDKTSDISRNLTRNQSRNQTEKSRISNQTANLSNSLSLTRFNEESLDVFHDFSDNMAKLNETEPAYLKSVQESLNISKQSPTLDGDLSMNFSPIKQANNIKDKFFKTPFKRPLARLTNLTSVTEEDQNEVNKEDFLGKDKLQSTFAHTELDQSNSRRSRLNEDEIRQNVEKELQNLKLRNEQPSNLTRRMEQTKSAYTSRTTDKLDKSASRTSALLEKTRSKIEEFKRQQLEKNKSKDKTTYDSTLLNIIGTAANHQTMQPDESKHTYTVENSRYFDTRFMMSNVMTINRTVDESKLENDKFRLIEEQLRQAEVSSTIRSSQRHAQSSSSLKDATRNEISKIERSSKSTSSISRAEDILSFDDSSDNTLVNTTGNQTFTAKYSSLDDQKMYLKFLNTQLIKIKDLEDKSKLIKKRREEKKSASASNLPTKGIANRTITIDKSLRTQSANSAPEKSTSNSPLHKSTETSNSLRTLSLNTISPSSIESDQMNLDSILSGSSNNLIDDALSLHSDDEVRKDKASKDLLSVNRSSPDNQPSPPDSSFHCECCRKRTRLNLTSKHVQTQQDELPVNNLTNINLKRKESEEYNQSSKELDRIQQQKPLNRKQTYNLLIERPIRETDYTSTKSALVNDQRSNDPQPSAENSFNLNNQSLDEIFRSKCPRTYRNIQYRRNQIQKKVHKRKEIEMMRLEAEKALKKQSKKNLKSTKQLKPINPFNKISSRQSDQARSLNSNKDLLYKKSRMF